MKRGFTILELLVVIAIIGFLATIVLAVTGDARSKGGDAGVKANLQTIRTQSGVFYADNGLAYTTGAGTFAIAACPVYSAASVYMVARDRVINDAIAQATTRGSGVNRCYNSATQWAVAVGLKTNANASWCVDSSGKSKQVAAAPASAISGTTFECN